MVGLGSTAQKYLGEGNIIGVERQIGKGAAEWNPRESGCFKPKGFLGILWDCLDSLDSLSSSTVIEHKALTSHTCRMELFLLGASLRCCEKEWI